MRNQQPSTKGGCGTFIFALMLVFIGTISTVASYISMQQANECGSPVLAAASAASMIVSAAITLAIVIAGWKAR